MSGGMGGWGVGGVGSERSVTERQILWGSDQARNAALWKSAQISGATRDAGNTPTTVLRGGLILGRLDSGLEYEEWDADASDGTQNIAGVLDTEMRAQDFYATNQDRHFRLLVARAPVRAKQLLIQGDSLVGHVDEYLARRQLVAAGFVFDDDPQGYKAGSGNRFATVTGTSDTLTADENGTTLIYNNVAAVGVVLPTIKSGLEYNIIRAADEELVVTGTGALFIGNDVTADSVTFTTAGEQIGAWVRIRSVYIGTTLKWLVEIVQVPFSTDNYLAMSIGT